MSKNTNISELINYLSYDGSGNIVFTTVSAAATNTDKFLVSDAGTLKFRTAAQLLSDIGAQASGSYQTALSGTGFVKISGSTISYDNSTYATETYVGTAISNLVASAPATLDTLNELALALGSDPNFATTVATSIGTKQPQLSGTGFVKISGTTISYDNSTYLTTSSASSTYLPLVGGTLTGALGGTSGTFSGTMTVVQYRIAPNGTNTVYNIVNSDNTYTGVYTLQAGGGSSGYGGGLNMFGHSHATKPGYVVAGISAGSGGKFTVNNQGNGGGTELFTVDINGITTLTNSLSGTSATFSSSVTATGVTVTGQTDLCFVNATTTMRIARSGSVARFQNYNGGSVANIALNWEGGNVGIGTDTPSLALNVIGQIRAGYAHNVGITFGLSPVGVPNNDNNAYILWGDSTSFGGNNGDLIYVPRTSTTGAHRFYTGNSSLATEKFTIANNGVVSINSTYFVPLTINTSYGQVGLEFQLNGTGFGGIGSGNNFSSDAGILATDVGIGTNGSATRKIIFATGSGYSTRMVITSAGTVGIGTTSPNGALSMNNQLYGGSTSISSYAAPNGTNGQNFFNGYYAVDSDGLGAYPRYFDIVSTGQPDGSNGGSNIRFFTNPTTLNSPAVERVRITSRGYVGIGRDDPSYALDVWASIRASSNGTFSPSLYLNFNNTNVVRFLADQNSCYIISQNAYPVEIQTNSVSKALFGSGANADVSFFTYSGYKQYFSGGDQYNVYLNNAGTIMYLNYQGNGGIRAGSSQTVLYAGSDIRIKKDITVVNSTLDKVLALTPKTFKYKDSKVDNTYYGFIAQDMEQVFPELVRTDSGVTMCNDEEIVNQKSIESYGLVWASILVKAIQELKVENDSLKDILKRNNII